MRPTHRAFTVHRVLENAPRARAPVQAQEEILRGVDHVRELLRRCQGVAGPVSPLEKEDRGKGVSKRKLLVDGEMTGPLDLRWPCASHFLKSS